MLRRAGFELWNRDDLVGQIYISQANAELPDYNVATIVRYDRSRDPRDGSTIITIAMHDTELFPASVPYYEIAEHLMAKHNITCFKIETPGLW